MVEEAKPAGTAAPAAPAAKGKSKMMLIAVILVVVVVVAAVGVYFFVLKDPIEGKWNIVSMKNTSTVAGNSTTTWDNDTGGWIEFKGDGTVSGSDSFSDAEWEASDGVITVTVG